MASQRSSSIRAVRSFGCVFLCCCYLANIEDIGTCDDVWHKCVNNGLELRILFVMFRDTI